jgi:hypothetical protein
MSPLILRYVTTLFSSVDAKRGRLVTRFARHSSVQRALAKHSCVGSLLVILIHSFVSQEIRMQNKPDVFDFRVRALVGPVRPLSLG